jgi:hypothetical protein
MRVAAGLLGRVHRQLLALLLLPSASACQYLFGDFNEEQVIEIDPSQFGGRDGTGGDQGTPASCAEGTVWCEGAELFACVDGFASHQDQCASADRCDATGAGRCLVCVDREFECIDDKNSRRCNDGAWADQPPCDERLTCDEDVEQCVACQPADGVCLPDGKTLCQCVEDQTGWEARTCLRGCKDEGFNDRCIDGLAMDGAPADACSAIGG